MHNELSFYGTQEAAAQLGIGFSALQMWLSRHPEYRPTRRFSGDDLLWLPEDIEKVRQARLRTAKHGNRRNEKETL